MSKATWIVSIVMLMVLVSSMLVACAQPAAAPSAKPAAPAAPAATTSAPKVVTPADMQAAAMLLTGNAVMAQQLVEAITLHRDQLAKALAAITTE